MTLLRWNFSRGRPTFRWRGMGDVLPVTTADAMAIAAVIGPPGPSGAQASLSALSDNQLTLDGDNRLYVGPPQLKSQQW